MIDNLRADTSKEILVHILDENENGVEQISEILAEYSGLDAVHLVSHGSDSGLQIGNTWLDSESLAANSEAVEGWRSALI